MRTKKKFSYSFILAILIVIVGPDIQAQSDHIKEDFTYTKKVNPGAEFTFTNSNCDIEIFTSSQPEIRYVLSVDAKLESEEDAEKLRKQFEQMELQGTGSRIEFSNSYYQSASETPFAKKMELRTGDKIRYSDIDITGKLYVPASVIFSLVTKYSTIEMEELEGDFRLKSYNDKVYGSNVNGKVEVDAKYSTLVFGNTGNMDLSLYNCRLNAGKTGHYHAEDSKYSKIELASAGDIRVKAFNDKYTIGKGGEFAFDAKYTDITMDEAQGGSITMYDGEILIKKTGDLRINSKYSGFELDQAERLEITNSYSDKFILGSLKTMNIASTKYSGYQIEDLSGKITVSESYSDKYTVSQTGSACKGMSINGKYVKVEFAVLPGLSYRIAAELKYSSLGLDASGLEYRKHVEKGSELWVEAIKGKESPDMAVFDLKGYDLSFIFTGQ